MKRWMKKSLVAILGATAILGGFSVWAHEHHGWQGMTQQDAAAMKARLVDKVGRQLDLDAAQRAKLGLVADRVHEQQVALMGASADPRADLQALITGPTFDRAKAQGLIQDKVSAVTAKSPEVVAALADFYDSLKPEQQAKVREFMARHAGGHHHG